MTMGAGLVRQKQHAAGPEVNVVVPHRFLIKRREEIQDPARRADLNQAISIVAPPGVGIESSVTRNEIDISCVIGSQTVAALPYPRPLPVGRVVWAGAEFHHLLERAGIEANHPTV